jgi:hypothetical protein
MSFESYSGQIFLTALVCSGSRRWLFVVVSEGASVKTVKRFIRCFYLKFEGQEQGSRDGAREAL